MTKRLYLIVLPILLLPYFTLFALATVFFSTKCSFFSWIMESVFQGNFLYLLAALLICCILAAVFSIVLFFVSINQKWDAITLAKVAVTVKLAQIPAYILIFVVGVVFLITIFTFAISIGLLVIDCLSVFLTGLLIISPVIITIRQGTFKPKEVLWVIILQFIFCADVVSTVMFYKKLKKIQQDNTNTKQ